MHPLAEAEAAELFRERALAVRSDFSGNEEVEAICRQVDCLPLAVELAAARVRVLSGHQILARLKRRLPLLTGGARDLPERQRTLRATIAWSYDLLEEQERRVFRRLAVFAGGCALEAAEEVCEANLDGLQLLVEKSLVQERDERFSMLETIREFALERLEESGEAEEMRRRHADHYLALAEQAEAELWGVNQRSWFDRLEAEHGNLRAALGWALAAGEPDAALRLAAAAELFWETRGYFREGRRWLAQAIEAGTNTSAAVRAKALFSAGRLALFEGDYGPARPFLEEAATLFREAANPRGLIWCLSNLAGVTEHGGEHERARALDEEAVSSARALGDRWLLATVLNNMSVTLMEQGDYAAARPLAEQSLALRRALADKRALAISLMNLGELAVAEGEHERAVAPLEESRDLSQEIGHVEMAAETTCGLGLATLLQGDTERAAPLFMESLTQCVEIGARIIAADCLSGLATLAGLDRDIGRAARLFGVAEAIREAAGIAPSPYVRPIYQRMLPRLRAEADEAAFSTEWSYGKILTLEDGVAYALHAPHETKTP